MPIIDKKSGVLVVRIVYDGPPLSGKTTTLQALGQGLGATLTTPAEENGRTLFFDWMEYCGGLFEGRRIRCQLVSVPGQIEYQHRRRALLEEADSVVMVANTRRGKIQEAASRLREIVAWSAGKDPPVGLVLQANQRDCEDCTTKQETRDILSSIAPIAMVETVATSGDGVREAFVLSVRMALDRVRALAKEGRLTEGSQTHSSPAELLRYLESLEGLAPAKNGTARSEPTPQASSSRVPTIAPSKESSTPSQPEPLAQPVAPPSHNLSAQLPASTRPAKESHSAPPTQVDYFLPDPMMPGGFIWPPVHGRTFLHEVAELQLELSRSLRGDRWASGAGWRVHSSAASTYQTTDEGRPALIDWARVHAVNGQRLSSGRAVILSPDVDETQRLWQLVRLHASLRERLSNALIDLSPESLAEEIFRCVSHLSRARRAMREGDLPVPCSLWTISAEVNMPPVYLGLMPDPQDERPEEPDGVALIEREFGPFLQSTKQNRDDFVEIATTLEQGGKSKREFEYQRVAQMALALAS